MSFLLGGQIYKICIFKFICGGGGIPSPSQHLDQLPAAAVSWFYLLISLMLLLNTIGWLLWIFLYILALTLINSRT
jgi:hypothetical protein